MKKKKRSLQKSGEMVMSYNVYGRDFYFGRIIQHFTDQPDIEICDWQISTSCLAEILELLINGYDRFVSVSPIVLVEQTRGGNDGDFQWVRISTAKKPFVS